MFSKKSATNVLELIDFFVSGDISASCFEKEYIDAWRNYRDFNDINEIDENTQIYIDRVFTTLDVYCSDPELRDENDLDDNELLNEVIELKDKWKSSNL